MKKRKNKKGRRNVGLLPASLYGAGSGVVAAVILLIAFSFVCTLSSDPDKLIIPLSLCASFMSFAVCGFCAARRYKGALPSGALSGAVLSVFFWIVSLFLGSGSSWGFSLTSEMLVRLSFVAVAILGAIVGKSRG